LYLCTALGLALALFLFGGERRGGLSLRDFLRFCLPKSVYLHMSARVDYGYFIVNRIVFGLLLLPIIAAVSLLSAAGTKALLDQIWHEPAIQLSGGVGWTAVHTVASVLAMDLGLFLAHYLQHRVPVLWEFHKVHHSAQVLTPLTAYRMHPVDDVLAMSLSGLFAGVVLGTFNFLQPGNAGAATVLGLNAALFLYYASGYNLRHSHVWLSYGSVLSRVFISPAQHQIHHSKAPQHFDKNFGFIFAFWDVWFGSLYVPSAKERIEVGLPDRKDEEYSSVLGLYLLPFKRSATTGARRASVTILACILVMLSAQSMLVLRTAFAQPPARNAGTGSPQLPAPQGVARAAPSVFLDDLTWTEARALIAAGHTIAIVPTGGTEQNGPHMVLGKHNYIVRHTAERIARRLGNALVAPVISYVPEGDIEPPTQHMLYAGTISIPERVFEAVLEHTARSLKAHGFTLICLLGDSGGNQKSQQRVAEKLNREWRNSGVRVLHVGDYYGKNGQVDWLKDRGESDRSIGFHAGIRDTSELLFVHPEGVRRDRLERTTSWKETGVDGDPAKASAERGQALLELKVEAAVRQISEALSRAGAKRTEQRNELSDQALSL
jgi:creatinine amidohydrolase/Fe(II)-dependent formamide hydrolase-like protein/sterol desaturase/sphingolipid hydroxylase (fatty acid hydroxylase superfamily)